MKPFYKPKSKLLFTLSVGSLIGIVIMLIVLFSLTAIFKAQQKDMNKQTAQIHFSNAWRYHSVGQFKEAEAGYQLLLKLDPENDNAYAMLSDMAFRKDEFQKAFELADKSVKINKDNLVGISNRAQAALRLGDNQKAIDDITSVMLKAKINPDQAPNDLLRTAYLIRSTAYKHVGLEQKSKWDIESAQALMKVNAGKEFECQSIEKRFKQKLNRPRFILSSNLTEEETKKYADFLDGFLDYIDENFYKLDKDLHVQVFILQNQKELNVYLKKYKQEGATGYFEQNQNAIFTSVDGGYGTFANLAMEKCIENIAFLDSWAVPGIPGLFEKIYGYRDGDKYSFLIGVPNSWAVKHLGDRLKSVTLIQPLTTCLPSQNPAEVRLLAAYLFQKNQLKQYLSLCETGPDADYASAFENLFQKPAKELESDWSKYISVIDQHRKTIEKTPPSQMFRSKSEFETFVNKHKLTSLKLIDVAKTN